MGNTRPRRRRSRLSRSRPAPGAAQRPPLAFYLLCDRQPVHSNQNNKGLTPEQKVEFVGLLVLLMLLIALVVKMWAVI